MIHPLRIYRDKPSTNYLDSIKMDGEQLCFSLGVYKEKYFKDHEKALAKVFNTYSTIRVTHFLRVVN